MENLFLIRYGEIGLKGENRSLFEDKLLSNIKYSIKKYDKSLSVYKTPGRIFLKTSADKDIVKESLQKTPGLVSFSPVEKVDLDIVEIKQIVLQIANSYIKDNEKI